MSVKIVRGKYVIADPDDDNPVKTDAALVIRDGTVEQVDDWLQVKDRFPEAEVLGSERHAVLPGFVNAHHHSNGVPYTLHGVLDDVLEPWILAISATRSQSEHLRTLFSAAQLLRTGVTSVVDLTRAAGARDEAVSGQRERAEAFGQSGLRAIVAPGASYESFLVHGRGEDERFIASLPDDLARRVRDGMRLEQALSPGDYLDLVSELNGAYRDHPTIDVWFGPPGPQWVGPELFTRIVERAESRDIGIQTHVVESLYEKLEGLRAHGRSTIAHLKELGVLSPRLSIAHGVWVTEDDIELLAETGAAISHNPSSNLRLRAGVAPLNALIAGGVTLGLGMDGTTINDDEDMFNEMRLALRLNRSTAIDEPVPSIREIFRLATTGGARLLRREHEIGKLLPGFKADLTVLDMDRITWPWMAPEADPLDVIVLRAKAEDVTHVLVNGDVALRDGQVAGFSLEDAARQLAEELERAELDGEFQALTADLLPHLRRWYEGWEMPERVPFAAFNSRV